MPLDVKGEPGWRGVQGESPKGIKINLGKIMAAVTLEDAAG